MMGTGDPYVVRPRKHNHIINKEVIKIFDWKSLHGKQVHVNVVELEGLQSVSLYEANTQKIYVVAVNKLEETK